MKASPRSPVESRYGTWFLLALFLILFLLCFDPDALAWDGAFYYGTARSLVFDGDLNLANDLVLARAVVPPDFAAAHFERRLTATGHVASPFALGTSLLWAPWFALVVGIARLAGVPHGVITGYEWYFRWTMAAVTAVHGWLAFLTCYRLLRRILDTRTALVTVLTAVVATPLLYYQFREPFYSHPVSALAVAAAVATWWRVAQPANLPSWRSALSLGAWIGLAALIRTQNILYLALPAFTTCAALISAARQRDGCRALRWLAAGLLTASSALLVLSPQFAAWQIVYGRPWLVPQGPRFVNWRAPWLGQVLLSPYHGLVPWLPLALPAGVGLVLAARRYPRRIGALCIALALQLYVNGCVADWAGGGGYGARRLSDTLVILAVGYACFLAWRSTGAFRAAGLALCAGLVVHQWLIVRYGFHDGLGGSVLITDHGRVIRAQAISEFGRQLAGYIPLAVRQPLRTLILPRSPLDSVIATPGDSAIQLALVVAILSVAHATHAMWRKLVHRRRCVWLPAFALLSAGILLLDGFLLTFG